MLPIVMLGATFLLFALTQTLSPVRRAALYIEDPRQMGSLDEVIKKYHLNDSVFRQYSRWLGNVFKGELGYSPTANMPVAKAVKQYLPATVELAAATMALVVFFGVWLGVLAAVNKSNWRDYLIRLFSVGTFSIPIFVLGLLLLMFFYGKLGWFPPGRYSFTSDIIIHGQDFRNFTGLLLVDSLLNLNFYVFFDALRHLVLPAVTLCMGSFALMIRVMRSSMLEELGKDYVRAARAKGLKENAVVFKHAGRNAIIPVITLAGIQFVRLLGGTIIVETIFNFPGIGGFGVNCARQLDIAGILGFACVVAFLFVLGNLAADILYTLVDPRIKYD